MLIRRVSCENPSRRLRAYLHRSRLQRLHRELGCGCEVGATVDEVFASDLKAVLFTVQKTLPLTGDGAAQV